MRFIAQQQAFLCLSLILGKRETRSTSCGECSGEEDELLGGSYRDMTTIR